MWYELYFLDERKVKHFVLASQSESYLKSRLKVYSDIYGYPVTSFQILNVGDKNGTL